MRVSTRVKTVSITAAALMLMAACGSGDSGGSTSSSTSGGSGGSNQTFKLGYVLPETGDLAFLGPPQIEAVKYAISADQRGRRRARERRPDVVGGDEANDQAIASQSADRVLNAGVNAIVGAAASAMSLAIIDKVTGAGVARVLGVEHRADLHRLQRRRAVLPHRAVGRAAGPGPRRRRSSATGTARSPSSPAPTTTARASRTRPPRPCEERGRDGRAQRDLRPEGDELRQRRPEGLAAKPDAVVVIAFEEGTQILAGPHRVRPDAGQGRPLRRRRAAQHRPRQARRPGQPGRPGRDEGHRARLGRQPAVRLKGLKAVRARPRARRSSRRRCSTASTSWRSRPSRRSPTDANEFKDDGRRRDQGRREVHELRRLQGAHRRGHRTSTTTGSAARSTSPTPASPGRPRSRSTASPTAASSQTISTETPARRVSQP